MKQRLESLLKDTLDRLQTAEEIPAGLMPIIKLERSKKKSRGHYISNLPLLLAKECKQAAHTLAAGIVTRMPPSTFIAKIEIAGAGCLNFFLKEEALLKIIPNILEKTFYHPESLPVDFTRLSTNDVSLVHYARTRIIRVLQQLKDFEQHASLEDLKLLTLTEEGFLIELLNIYPEILEEAVNRNEPHILVHYLGNLAQGLHNYYNAVTLLAEDEGLRKARLSLLQAIRHIIDNGLGLLGIQSPESM